MTDKPCYGLGSRQRRFLAILRDEDWHLVTELADAVSVDSGEISSSLRGLVSRDLVERRPSLRGDARTNVYRLTEAGIERLEFCDRCGKPHPDRGAALECCADALETVGGTTTIRGPSPAQVERGESR